MSVISAVAQPVDPDLKPPPAPPPAPQRAHGDRVRLPGLTASRDVASARHLTRAALHTWGLDKAAPEGQLVVSELITNALQSSPMASVTLYREPAGVLVMVDDISPQPPQWPLPARDEEETGRGLLLVAALTTDLGYCHHPGGGKTVWARIRTVGEPT